MKSPWFTLALLAFAIVAFSCQPQPTTLTQAQKTAMADSAKAVVQSMLSNADKLDFVSYFTDYSPDPDAHYVENGHLYKSLDKFKNNYANAQPLYESLKVTADTWDMITVLSSDVVHITMPFHFTFTAKGCSEYTAEGVWTGLVQRRGGKWTIIQSHESWLNAGKVMAAFVPPAKQPRSKK